MVAFAPTSARVHHGLNNFEPSTPQMQNWVMNNLPDEFEHMLRNVSPGIEFIDLTVPLREAAAAGTRIRVRTLLTAMRHAARSREIAELAVAYRKRGVGGFDIAGAEAGFPPTRHLDAFEYLRRENAHFTIHAGEAFGLPSIWEAIQWCGADRLGHGVRIVDDITTGADGIPVLGGLSAYLRDCPIPPEICPSPNIQPGAAGPVAALGVVAVLASFDRFGSKDEPAKQWRPPPHKWTVGWPAAVALASRHGTEQRAYPGRHCHGQCAPEGHAQRALGNRCATDDGGHGPKQGQ